MKKRFLLPLVLLLVGCKPQIQGPVVETSTLDRMEFAGVHYETVLRVIDGDTFQIAARWSPYPLDWKIRILGIDTPEKGYRAKCPSEKNLSEMARNLTDSLIRESRGVVRLTDVRHDKFGGRMNAHVYLRDGRNVGEELIRAGLAKRYTGDGPKPNWCKPHRLP